MVLPATCFHCTGTSVIRSPSRRARARISTSKAKRSMGTRWNRSRATGVRKALNPHWVSCRPSPVPVVTIQLKSRPITARRA